MALDTVDMTGKVILLTGANSGIGKATAELLAKMGATLVMVCRDKARGEAALADVKRYSGNEKVELMLADLASFDSVRNLAASITEKHPRLDVLINNAAVMPSKRCLTRDGFEAQFGVNHLAPFLLTHLLTDALKLAAPSRIVNVASTLHQSATMNFDDIQSEGQYRSMRCYGQSKLANVLFTYESAKRLEGTGVMVNCLHPGVVRSNILRDLPVILKPLVALAGMFMLSPHKGAETSVYVAASPQLEGVTGKYFVKCAEARSSSESHDDKVAKRLWELSSELTACETA